MEFEKLWDSVPPRIMQKVQERAEQRRRAEEALGANCSKLGIDYSLSLTADALTIARAVEIRRDCEGCKADPKLCKHIKELYSPDGIPLNEFCRCGRYEAVLNAQRVRQRAEALLSKSGLGKRFAGRRFETFKPTPETLPAYNACIEFCNNFTTDSRGIRLTGNYGTGKTHLSAAIINRLAGQGIAGVFVVVPELLDAIRKSYDSKEAQEEEIIKIAETAPLLVLDDLGAEKPSEWAREKLYIIINRRYEDMLPTIITTNCTTAELIDRVGQRIVSRIIEMTAPYKIEGIDYRMRV